VTAAVRSPLSVTYAVWRALFLREAVFRLSGRRAAWLWLLLEPIFHVAFITFLFEIVRMRVIPGADPGMFVMTGLLAFFMTRNTALRCMEAIRANSALFAYRQVKPVDTVIVRAGLEGFLGVIVTLIMLTGAALFGFDVIPPRPLEVLVAFAGLWILGLGVGLVLSVLAELVPEMGNVVRLLFMPIYFLSGIMFPVAFVPQPYREWLFYNPILHGVEILRGGFFRHYHLVPEANLSVLLGFALAAVFFGLALQVRYARKIIAQ
jgi:capsular polysaccharide transport system permease protein